MTLGQNNFGNKIPIFGGNQVKKSDFFMKTFDALIPGPKDLESPGPKKTWDLKIGNIPGQWKPYSELRT